MTKSKIEIQAGILLERINSGELDVVRLRNAYRNILRNKDDLSDDVHETLVEAIETNLRKYYPKQANQAFGKRNEKTSAKLIAYFEDLQIRFDLSANGHKNKVKVGGNVIAGDAYIFDYVSYRNNGTMVSVEMAYRQIAEDTPLEIVVTKRRVRGHTDEYEDAVFTPEQFDEAAAFYESHLGSILK